MVMKWKLLYMGMIGAKRFTGRMLFLTPKKVIGQKIYTKILNYKDVSFSCLVENLEHQDKSH